VVVLVVLDDRSLTARMAGQSVEPERPSQGLSEFSGTSSEYFSEDPLISGTMAARMISGAASVNGSNARDHAPGWAA
jgi:hypothetical protein